MQKLKYKFMFFLCFAYEAAMVYLGYKQFISWPLVVASGLPDGIAIYFALLSLVKSEQLEEHILSVNEATLAYLETDEDLWRS